MNPTGEGALLERQEELSRCDVLLAEARGGDGRALLIRGPAGIGKSRLLEEVRERGGAAGMRVLSARGAELERDFAHGVVRQLFEPALARAEPRERERLLSGAARLAARLIGAPDLGEPAPAADPSFAGLHGLYWLTANLTESAALVLTVDDVHWADGASAAYLAYLSRRLEGLPILLALAGRPAERGVDTSIDQLAATASAIPVVEPRALSESAVGELVRAGLGAEPAAGFRSACRAATGGNPFLVRELVGELADRGLEPNSSNAARVLDLGPESVARAVLARVARLPPPCTAVARALAILGDGADLRVAANLAGIEEAQGGQAVDALAGAQILSTALPIEFVHPTVRASIAADLPPVERSRLHARAARLIAESGGTSERVAAHLLLTEPGRDGWVLEMLRAAAGEAFGRGAPETAASFLERALRESGCAEIRPALLRELGLAAILRGSDTAAVASLEEALRLERGLGERVLTGRLLGHALMLGGRGAEGVKALTETIVAVGDGDHALREQLEAELVAISYFDLSARRLVERSGRPRLDSSSAAHCAVLATDRALGGTASEASELARLALADPAVRTAETPLFHHAAGALLFSDELQAADDAYGAEISAAGASGSIRAFVHCSALRALARYRGGSLPAAEADARSALESYTEDIPGMTPAVIAAHLALPLIERGDVAAASEVLERHAVPSGTQFFLEPILIETRARLAIAQGRLEAGLDLLRDCGRHEREWAVRTPALTLWRSEAAVALAALGRADEAAGLAREGLDAAREFGAPRALGMALRAAGIVEDGERGLELIREAVSVLESSRARLEGARTLVELGAALRRSKARTAAREPLREGIVLARRCGATTLAERAYEELLATGARPRKILLSGAEALTASERRIAAMAADGMSNREIAQALFLTVRTVETHLSHCYQKLDIRSRGELAGKLGSEASS